MEDGESEASLGQTDQVSKRGGGKRDRELFKAYHVL